MSGFAENATETSAAYLLEGLELDDGWTVLAQATPRPNSTGGACSVGYLAVHESGQAGFLKAIDYAAALDSADPAKALEELTASFNAEREILDLCLGRKLRRVVRALSSGTVRIPAAEPSAVSYLIFEMADGDARDILETHDPADILPRLELAHHAAVGMNQLHSLGAAHQDLKPSNFLIWANERTLPSGKLSDLGVAHHVDRPAPHDGDLLPGDPAYAAPEQLYASETWAAAPERRRAADVFTLGNLLSFLLTGVTFSGVSALYLDKSQGWTKWEGTFEEVLPGLTDAHGEAVARIRAVLYADVAEPLAEIIGALCYPDPSLRGDPVARRDGKDQFRLDRVVTKLDLIRRRAELVAGRK